MVLEVPPHFDLLDLSPLGISLQQGGVFPISDSTSISIGTLTHNSWTKIYLPQGVCSRVGSPQLHMDIGNCLIIGSKLIGVLTVMGIYTVDSHACELTTSSLVSFSNNRFSAVGTYIFSDRASFNKWITNL